MWTWSKFESQRARLCVTRRHFVKPADRWLFSCKLSVLNNFVFVLYIAPKKIGFVRASIGFFHQNVSSTLLPSRQEFEMLLCVFAVKLHNRRLRWPCTWKCVICEIGISFSTAFHLQRLSWKFSNEIYRVFLENSNFFFWLLTLNHSIKNKIAEFTKIDSRAQFSKPNWIISAQKAMNIFFLRARAKKQKFHINILNWNDFIRMRNDIGSQTVYRHYTSCLAKSEKRTLFNQCVSDGLHLCLSMKQAEIRQSK